MTNGVSCRCSNVDVGMLGCGIWTLFIMLIVIDVNMLYVSINYIFFKCVFFVLTWGGCKESGSCFLYYLRHWPKCVHCQ